MQPPNGMRCFRIRLILVHPVRDETLVAKALLGIGASEVASTIELWIQDDFERAIQLERSKLH